jgi:hypothetical protein
MKSLLGDILAAVVGGVATRAYSPERATQDLDILVDHGLDLMATDQTWAKEALAEEAFDQTGLRIVALPYLVLMKVDSAHGIDQGDLTRMLGRATASDVERTVRVVEKHHGDPHAAEDVRQYAALGAMEYERPEQRDSR